MTQGKLIEAVLAAPPERHAAIFRAATAEPGRPKMGTANDGAALLGVSVKTFRRYVQRGMIPARRLSRRMVRYDLGAVEALLSPGTAAGGAA